MSYFIQLIHRELQRFESRVREIIHEELQPRSSSSLTSDDSSDARWGLRGFKRWPTAHYEVVPDRDVPDTYRVEHIMHEHEGMVRVATFSGPEAKERAEEYATFMRVRGTDSLEPGVCVNCGAYQDECRCVFRYGAGRHDTFDGPCMCGGWHGTR